LLQLLLLLLDLLVHLVEMIHLLLLMLLLLLLLLLLLTVSSQLVLLVLLLLLHLLLLWIGGLPQHIRVVIVIWPRGSCTAALPACHSSPQCPKSLQHTLLVERHIGCMLH
jgi:hypothetical protein